MTRTPRALIGSRSFGGRFPEHLDELARRGVEVVPNDRGRAYRADELGAALADVDAIVTGTDELTAEVIDGAPRLRAIVKHGVGLDNVDLAAAQRRGIAVSATPGAMDDSVADMTLALLLAAARDVVGSHQAVAGGSWTGRTGIELRGRTLVLIGYGRIGRAVAVRARAFGMRIVAHDPFAEPGDDGVPLLPLDEALAVADIVSLHAAAAGEVLLDRRAIALLPAGAIVVNTARGSLVDEQALADALDAGRLAGAAVDVVGEEPPTTSPLLGRSDVVITAHIAGRTEAALRRMGEITVRNVLAGLGLADPPP